MKHLRKILLILLSILSVFAVAVFAAACGDGDEKDPDNGDNSPQTVAYTTEVYLAEGDAYVLSAEKSGTGAGEVGKTITLPAPTVEGYVFNQSHAGNVTSLTLSANAAENVFRFYYDAETAGSLVYDGNAPQGATVRGSVESTPVGTDGTATAAENGFRATGFRFAGWSYARNGAATVQPGDKVTATEPVTLYAVWDRGYTNRAGGTDYVYVLSAESGKVVLERGETELGKTDLVDGVFTFTMPNNDKLEGKVFGDGTFAYARSGLEGKYTFHTSYYNVDSPDGTTPPDPDTTLTLDKFGDGTFAYVDEDGVSRSEKGYIRNHTYGESPEYLFFITEGANAGGGFVFRLGVYGDKRRPIYTTTNGEAATYDQALTPDGNIFYGGQGFSIQLDGYGTVIMQHADYTGEWEGYYWIEGMYDLSEQYSIYKLHLRVTDDNGTLNTLSGGAVVDGVLDVSCYTMPLNDSSYAYVEPNEEAGEYHSQNGTLTLDGFKNFADSATYVVDGQTQYGSYEAIWSQTDSQLTVVMHVNDLSGAYLGRDITFKIGLTLESDGSFTIGDTFTVVTAQSEGTSYRLLTDTAFGNTLLTIYKEDYEDESGTVLGKKASYGTVNTLGAYQKLADGYVEEGTFGYAPLVTFTRVSLTGAEDDGTVPKSMICQLSATYESNFFLYDIYFVYSATYYRDSKDVTVKNYIELVDETEGSEAKIWYMTLPAQGLNAGALYFDDDETVAYAGAFTTDDGAYFGPVGIFTVLDPDTGDVDYYYYDLQRGSGGSYAIFTPIDEPEYYVITMDYTGELDQMVHLIRRGGEALYSASGDFDSGTDVIRGTVEWVGETKFGDDIFVFKNGEQELLRFIMEETLFSEPGYIEEDIFIYISYDASFDKQFTAGGTSLTLDGFHRGSYTVDGRTYQGTYTLSADKKIVYLSTTGRNFTFDISNGLTATDGIYGMYELYAGGWWNVTFDGHGNATATLRGRTETGIYLIQDDGTVLLFINLISGVTSYRLQLVSIQGHGEARVYDENVAGTFIGDDWTILYLDGFHSGSYYYPDGVGWSTIYYDILDSRVGFVSIRSESYEVWNVVLDFDNKTMSYPTYVDRDYLYYAADLSALIIRESGEIEMNYTSGSYIFANGVYRAYLMESAGTYSVDLGGMPPASGPWTVDGKTYYPATRGQEVTLSGTVSVEHGGTKEEKLATLTFKLTGESVMYMDGKLTYDGTDYDVDLINTYVHNGKREKLSIVDWTRYDYSPFTTCTYQGDGTGTFTVEIKAQELTLTDVYDADSTLTEYRVGFGPLDFEDRTLSGKVSVGGGKYLEFSGAKIQPTDYVDADTGRRYIAVFEVGGTTYALQYSKEGSDRYSLYLIGTYEKVTANNGYSVGVIRYFYSNEAYTHTTSQKGAFCDFILYDENGTVVSFSRAVNEGGTSGWYVAVEGYDPTTQTGYPETIYLVNFADDTLKSATVTAYSFMQGADDSTGNYVNLCLDENGEIVEVAMVCVGEEFCSVKSLTKNADGSYRVELTDDTVYTLTVVRDENGDPLTYDDGTWQVTLTLTTAA